MVDLPLLCSRDEVHFSTGSIQLTAWAVTLLTVISRKRTNSQIGRDFCSAWSYSEHPEDLAKALLSKRKEFHYLPDNGDTVL